MNEIYLFGDSVSQGLVLDDNGQYRVSRAGCVRLLKKKGYPIQNYAAHGQTVAQGLDSFHKIAMEPGSFCIIQFGGNDSDLDWDAVSADPETYHEGRLSLGEFRKKLTCFVREAREKQLKPVLITPLALMSDRFCRWISKGRNAESILHYLRNDLESIARWQERYSIAVRSVSEKEKCPLVDARSWMLNQLEYPSLMCDDGMHPNEAGHAVLADAIDAHCRYILSQ